jgi:hypothetical protein
LPVDLDFQARFLDNQFKADTGIGTPPIVDMGAYEQFFEPMDADANGTIDLRDMAAFQACFGKTTAGCLEAFDRIAPDDVIDSLDWEIMESQVTGPCSGGAMMLLEGQGMMSMLGEFGEVAEEPGAWTYDDASLAIEIRPAGGGDPVTTLQPHTTYALYYNAGYSAVNSYTALVTASAAGQGLSAAAAATTGDWSLAGHFAYLDGSAGGGSLTQVIMDDFAPEGEAHAGSTGYVCEFTTGDAGQLSIELIATWTDLVAHETVIMQAQQDLIVQP